MKTVEELLDKYIGEGRYQYVIRNRKKVKRLRPKKGFKVVDGKYVKMKSSEKRKRKRSAIKSSRKRKSKRASIQRKRNKSMRKRKSLSL